jgi:hypothetical protein
MLHRLVSWTRRNTRRAVALALALGLAMLAVDAAIGHFAGKDFDNRLQLIPVIYGALGFVVLLVVVWPTARAPFAWSARLLGVAGVLVGLAGAGFHLNALLNELEGEYSWSALEGGLSLAPPVFAPLGFAAIGALLWLLPSPRLLLRLRIGIRGRVRIEKRAGATERAWQGGSRARRRRTPPAGTRPHGGPASLAPCSGCDGPSRCRTRSP